MLQAGDFTTGDIAAAQFAHSASHAKSGDLWAMSRMVHGMHQYVARKQRQFQNDPGLICAASPYLVWCGKMIWSRCLFRNPGTGQAGVGVLLFCPCTPSCAVFAADITPERKTQYE
jgi:hypothetical protein